MELLVVAVLGLLGIAGATAIGPKLGFSAPLLLVIVGILVSFLPFVPDVEIDPEWIIAGVLPPLLYSASVSMPSMEFRREFGAISGLSVSLVVVSSVALGLLFTWIVPGLSLAAGIALGAIVSPTDAVATSIVKRVGVTPRIVTVLEGESLLNDATALVLLRSAIAATAAAVSFWEILGDFVFAVVVAVVIGYLVGKGNLWLRSRVTDATVNTVISFTVPFLASVPSEVLGASGLVAAVVAGLVTGRGAIRSLSPQHRMSDVQNWRTIELILEGAVFLVMGLEMSAILGDLTNETRGIELGGRVAAITLLAVIVVRALFVFPMLGLQRRSSRRGASMKPRLTAFQERLDTAELGAITAPDPRGAPGRGRPGRELSAASLGRFRSRIRRKVADIDYFVAEPLGWREGTVIVWAGMRGAVTLAAAQTLPQGTPDRSLVIFIAFLVATGSLLIQGGTLPWIVRLVKPAGVDREAARAEHAELLGILRRVADDVVREHREARAAADGGPGHIDGDPGTDRELHRALRLEIIHAQREALLTARDDGTFSASVLTGVLETLDADQISIELREEHRDEA
ncbi:sodium/proton antiporter (CPA1 family) [Agromyces ramosus]|uniref:Sodium/proton antiporter (CPA1 family) n=1 Tax=Agromyces ramosus TaxID=33879 RepID=A0A4Q7MET2_9MICO|nr:sodium:proton antiporter [Agromyces ramosus]RZS66604.1 sodium/proton antiporter (CPA1 family) [Agromyces ramosus]